MANGAANNMTFSPAGQALGLGTAPGDETETEEQKKKRLAAIAQSQSRLNGGQNFSAAGQTLMSYSAMSGGGLGF
jgi:hypothetical protein